MSVESALVVRFVSVTKKGQRPRHNSAVLRGLFYLKACGRLVLWQPILSDVKAWGRCGLRLVVMGLNEGQNRRKLANTALGVVRRVG